MPKRPDRRKQRVEDEQKKILVAFSDYENQVTLICSLESWFQHHWGDDGQDAGRLKRFDRFPQWNGLTPDFAVHFRTPYVLCGEIMKTFRKDRGGHDDLGQIVSYSHHQPDPPEAGYDVLLLVDTHCDDVAAKSLERARRSKEPEERPRAPVVVVGFYLQSDRVHGEWYDLKWRDQPGNSRFTHPNVSSDPKATDLNKLITKASHCAIRVDRPALVGAGRSPLINDEPPPLAALRAGSHPHPSAQRAAD